MKPARLAFPVLVVVLAIWGMTDIRRRARTDPARPEVHRTDLTVYTGAARELLGGRDPYVVTNPRGMHYLYPPLFALLLTPLARLDPQAQAVIFFAVSCLLTAGCAVEIGKIARTAARARQAPQESKSGRPPDRVIPLWIVVSATLAVLLPTLNTLQRGQANIAVLYPLLLGFRVMLAARSSSAAILGGVLLALPVALKLTPALPAAFVLFQEVVAVVRARGTDLSSVSRHAAGGALRAARLGSATTGFVLGLALFYFLVPAACVGWHSNLRLLETWRARVAVNDNVGVQNAFNNRSYRNQSLENAAYHAGNFIAHMFAGGPDDRVAARRATTQSVMPMDGAWFDAGVTTARAVLLLLLLLAGLRFRVIDGALHRTATFGLACLLTLIVSPLSWAHHYVIALPATVFVPMALIRAGRQRTAVVFAAGLAALSIVHYALLDHVGRVGLLGLGTGALAMMALTALTWGAGEFRSFSSRK